MVPFDVEPLTAGTSGLWVPGCPIEQEHSRFPPIKRAPPLIKTGILGSSTCEDTLTCIRNRALDFFFCAVRMAL